LRPRESFNEALVNGCSVGLQLDAL
jgi:hypothetical protein